MGSNVRARQESRNDHVHQLGEQEQGGLRQPGSEEQQHLGQLGGQEIQGPHQPEKGDSRRHVVGHDGK